MNDDNDLWNALAHTTRRQVLDFLKDGPMTTGEICEKFDTSRYAIMKHLTVLVEADLIIFHKKGRKRYNYINPVPLQRALSRWLKPFEKKAVERLNDLKEAVERSNETND